MVCLFYLMYSIHIKCELFFSFIDFREMKTRGPPKSKLKKRRGSLPSEGLGSFVYTYKYELH